ncbi:MAG: GNAT family N-acetyltransferase [Thiobacillus sp.]
MAGFSIHETDWMHDAARLGAIRRAVFIDEQGVPESLEWDEYDACSVHLLATADDGGTPIGCARLLPDGHLGRMAVLRSWRGQGVGSALLKDALAAARRAGMTRVELSAQCHATDFYRRAGFVQRGAVYQEAGIPHVSMTLSLIAA